MYVTVAICCRTLSILLAEKDGVDLCIHFASLSLCLCIGVTEKKSRTTAKNVSPVILTKSKSYLS